jgi:hypothetical protein
MRILRRIEELLGLFINDVEKGVEPERAGWTEVSESESYALIQMGICEKSQNRIRIALKPLPDEVLAKISRENIWLEEARREIIKALSVEKEIVEIISNDLTQPAAIYLGFGRMLKSSNFPVVVDLILREGFNMDTWPQKVWENSDILSLMVIERWWDKERVKQGLLKFSTSEITQPTERIDKIVRVLKWNIAVEILRKEEVLALGLLWFADSKIEGLLYPESFTYVQRKVWKTIESIVRMNSITIRKNIAYTLKRIERQTSERDMLGRFYPIANWNSIIRIPW